MAASMQVNHQVNRHQKDVLIECRNVRKTWDFPGQANVTVLDDINLEVREGEFLSILGPSGSGKSTLLRIMAGVIQPSAGEVFYRGRPLTGVNPGVAMVFQTFALYPWLTVLENVEMGLEAMGVPRSDRRRRAERVIDLVGLDGFESAFPKELSGGMRQRVGLARALAVEPDVLMMDEPFSALDVLTAENLRRDLLDLWLERQIPTRAIIMVTHSIEEAIFMADQALVLSRDPARVIMKVPINLAYPRDRDDKAFKEAVDHIYGALTSVTPAGTPAAPGRDETARAAARPAPATPRPGVRTPERPALPPVRAGGLTGLIEYLDEAGGRADLATLADDFMLDLEDLLPIVDAIQLLGFGTVEEGDVILNDIGRSFARASVVERKDIFRQQVLANVPQAKQIRAVLESKVNRRMPREFFLDILGRRFGPAEAEEQLSTLIDWGRYAEILAYDDEGQYLYLEEEDATAEAHGT